jgi:predicted CXXCH cytochrome family protein
MFDHLTVRCGGGPIMQLALILMLLFALAPGAEAARDISPQRECANCHIMWLVDFNRKDVTTLIAYNPKPVEATGKQDVVSTDRMCFSCHDGFVLDSRFAWQNRQNFHPIGVKPSDKVDIPTVEGKMIFPLNDDGKVYCGTCHSAHGVEWGGGVDKPYPVFMRMKNIESSMCMACHLERGTGPDEGNHPISQKMQEIPHALTEAGSKFGRSGNVICQSCHRVHGAPEKRLLAVKNSNSELCGTCHSDRYARTPAEAGSMGTHPVNIKPGKVKIPQALFDKGAKLGEGGTVICQTCHTPHFAAAGPKLLITGNPDSELCKTCHVDQRKVVNTKHNMKLVNETTKNVREQEVGKAGVCSACHLPHSGKGPKMWARPVTHGDDPVADLCLSCHKEGGLAKDKQVGRHTHPVGRDMARLDGAVDLPGYTREGVKSVGDGKGRVTCPTCHDPHQWDPRDPEKTSKPGEEGSDSNKFLRKPNGPEADLCLTCHKNKIGVVNTKHDLAVMAPTERNIKGQTPAETGVCASCHLPHNGKGARMWAREPLAGVDPVSSTCLSCHNSQGVAKDKTIGANSHPLDVPIANIGITAKDGKWSVPPESVGQPGKVLPLYDHRGMPAAEGGNVVCGTCHDPHNWSPLTKDSPSGDPRQSKGTGDTSFLRLPNDNKGTLCANCHVDKGPIALSKHNLAISAPDAKNSKGRTTAETGVCGSCHLPHNGNGAKMWARATGPGQDGVEVLCAECHRDGGIASKKQTGANSHPLRVDLKSIGGKTTLPLYTAEGKKDHVNGKIACATCHNLHQWNPADPASKAGAKADVEGGAVDSFLRQPAWPAPQLCANCHQDKRQVKNTDHDLAVTAPEATNIRGQNARESGVCGQCHMVHNAVAKERLWARQSGEGNDAMERLCRSCHAAGKVAAAKLPLKGSHPAKVNVISNPGSQRENGGIFPVFTPEGVRSGSGIISCPTCHNAHQWSPLKAEEGEGRNVEGDARSSFLRNTSDFSLCADCHGLDALFRYKYYHGETSRKKHMLYR